MAEPGDGFNIIQKRIWELQNFEVILPGEPGYIEFSDIFLMVDNTTWSEAKKISLVDFITNVHKEQGPVDIDSVNVEETYNVPFSSNSYYIRIDAWREYTHEGVTYRENIPIQNFNKELSGFSFTLSSYQEGDVVDYIAFE
jgi:hypothetical protein